MKKNSLDQPVVSVIMPVYNGSCFMEQAIESILSQTYQNFELIIVNDFSTDNTPVIIERYCRLYPKKIKVIHLRKRYGAYGAANVAIRRAKGEFIAPMDSDDISYSERLQKQVNFLLTNKEVIVVGTQARIIDREGIIIGKKIFPTTHKEIYKKFFGVFPIVHPSCMIRRSLLPNKNKLYENKFGVNDDYFTFFKLLNYGKFYNLSEYLFSYRIHGGNFSLLKLKEKFFNTLKIRLLAIKRLNYHPSPIGLLNLLGQTVLVVVLPESILLRVYLLIKGIRAPQEASDVLTRKIDIAFAKAKSIPFSLLNLQQ